jgi:hypothetical protein
MVDSNGELLVNLFQDEAFTQVAYNGLALGDVAAKRTDFYRQDRTFS